MNLLKRAAIEQSSGAASSDFTAVSLSRKATSLLLCLVVCIVILAGFFVIRDLHSADLETKKMYAESVIGMRRIADLQYAAQETRRATFYALSTADSNLHVRYADQSREADSIVSQGIVQYLHEQRTPKELEVGRRLHEEWAAYLKVRDEVLASILEGSIKEAMALEVGSGVELFEPVRKDLAEVERLYDDQASQRLANVAASSRRTVFRLVGVLGFTLVFAIASVWMIQRSKVASALQLARMQMDFVASVSHELRTPLAVISSAADNIADGVVVEKEGLKKYGSAIRNQSRQMTELVNQILLFAATKDEAQHHAMRELQVAQVLEAALHQTSELAKGSGFAVELHVEPDLPAVLADESGLSRCVQNLIVNAIKYSGESRWIGVKAFLGDSVVKGEREIRISIQDHGIGISTSDLPRIFDPFYRSRAVIAEQVHGTGLGLSLSKSIAEAMDGRLTVISDLGKGSTFTIHLPASSAANLTNSGPILRSTGQVKI
jgi:signal transduction histidine kinase